MSGSEPVKAPARAELEQLRERVMALEHGEKALTRVEAALAESTRLAALTRDISVALIQSSSLSDSLQQCARALVTHLEAAFARIWTLNGDTQVLELQASAGMYTHLNGAHSRVLVGSLKIGLIAAERLPHLTNAVLGDPRVSDQEWARREGMVSFAGYPLLIEGELVGVMALFARVPLSTAVLDAMASVSNTIALGIQRKRVEEERIRLLESEQRAHSEVEAALQMRNDFLSSISHDLKTPLAVMKGNVQLLRRRLRRGGALDPIWLADRLAVIESSIGKMTGMVEDLLDVAKLQTGQKLDLEMRPVRLIPLLHQVSAEQQAMTRRHQVVVQAPEEEVVIQGDRVRLDRVLTNLLANAIKYSPDGGKIMVQLVHEEEQGHPWVAVSIRDQGVGIPSADLPRIFDPFYRADNVARRIQGTGIGLASAAQVITQHGGTISVSSEEGRGSTFVVRLPWHVPGP